MTASVWPKWDRYEWDAWIRVYSDMTETPNLPLTLIWLRRLDPNLHTYDWDAQFFWSLFLSVSQSQVCRIEKRKQKNFGCPSHICASLGQGVSVILVSTVSLASQSYHCKLWFKRLNHISLDGRPLVSLISVSFGSFWRSNFQNLIFWTKKFRENFSPKIDTFPKLWAHTKCVNLWRPIVRPF